VIERWTRGTGVLVLTRGPSSAEVSVVRLERRAGGGAQRTPPRTGHESHPYGRRGGKCRQRARPVRLRPRLQPGCRCGPHGPATRGERARAMFRRPASARPRRAGQVRTSPKREGDPSPVRNNGQGGGKPARVSQPQALGLVHRPGYTRTARLWQRSRAASCASRRPLSQTNICGRARPPEPPAWAGACYGGLSGGRGGAGEGTDSGASSTWFLAHGQIHVAKDG